MVLAEHILIQPTNNEFVTNVLSMNHANDF